MKSLVMKAFTTVVPEGLGVHINFLLSGLGVFTQARPNVAAERHNVEQKIMS